jgi:hypothetical protein
VAAANPHGNPKDKGRDPRGDTHTHTHTHKYTHSHTHTRTEAKGGGDGQDTDSKTLGDSNRQRVERRGERGEVGGALGGCGSEGGRGAVAVGAAGVKVEEAERKGIVRSYSREALLQRLQPELLQEPQRLQRELQYVDKVEHAIRLFEP